MRLTLQVMGVLLLHEKLGKFFERRRRGREQNCLINSTLAAVLHACEGGEIIMIMIANYLIHAKVKCKLILRQLSPSFACLRPLSLNLRVWRLNI
jgi:hypothetical protein